MLYAILCYNSEQAISNWSDDMDQAVMAHHLSVAQKFAARGKVGPVVRLMPTTTATTVRAARHPVAIDGPFAETKEQLLGFYLVEVGTLEEAIQIAGELAHDSGGMEVRPIHFFSDFSNPSPVFGATQRAAPLGWQRQVP
jgi:hypothetical protein